MSAFFKNKKEENEHLHENAFLPTEDVSGKEDIDTETTKQKKRELFQNFTNNRFAEITRNAELKDFEKLDYASKAPQLINMDVLDAYITKIVEEKILQFEMRLKMELDLKEKK